MTYLNVCAGQLTSSFLVCNAKNSSKSLHIHTAEVVVAPTSLHLTTVKDSLRKDFAVSAQNSWTKGPGAWTGEITAEHLVDLDVPWVILGHSERRHIIGESDEVCLVGLFLQKTLFLL